VAAHANAWPDGSLAAGDVHSGHIALFNMLCGRKTHGEFEGSITYRCRGGLDAVQFRQHSTYVPAQPHLPADLTIRQLLGYAARLSLPRRTTAAEIAQRVDDVAALLGLDAVLEKPLTRSAGSTKRRPYTQAVAIAMELLSDPGWR